VKVKSYQKGDVEIKIMKVTMTLYDVSRIVKGCEANEKSFLRTNEPYENADEIFDYCLDMELENDK